MNRPADIGRRLIAKTIDVSTYLLLAATLLVVFMFWMQSDLLNAIIFRPEIGDEAPWFLSIRAFAIPSSGPWSVLFALQILGVLLLVGAILYEVPLTAIYGQTAGKTIANVVVIRTADGRTPGWSTATIRAAVQFLPLLIPVVGLGVSVLVGVSPLWCRTRRGWHDKLAGTIVVAAHEGR